MHTLKPALVTLLLLAATLGAASAHAQATKCWSMAGGAGTVASLESANHILLFGGVASIRSTTTFPANAYLSYPITAVDGLVTQPVARALRVGLMDNGSSARILVHLRKVSLATGILYESITLDSNGAAPSGGMQIREFAVCNGDPGWSKLTFDFTQFAYFVDVQLTRSDSTGQPQLFYLQIVDRPVC